jgi:hypothetical protein
LRYRWCLLPHFYFSLQIHTDAGGDNKGVQLYQNADYDLLRPARQVLAMYPKDGRAPDAFFGLSSRTSPGVGQGGAGRIREARRRISGIDKPPMRGQDRRPPVPSSGTTTRRWKPPYQTAYPIKIRPMLFHDGHAMSSSETSSAAAVFRGGKVSCKPQVEAPSWPGVICSAVELAGARGIPVSRSKGGKREIRPESGIQIADTASWRPV